MSTQFRAVPSRLNEFVGNAGAGAGLLGAAVAVTAWGSASVLAKLIDLGGLVIAVYRFGAFALLLGCWLRLRGTRIDRFVLRHSALGGLALGVDVALFFSAVKMTSVINATLIGALQPVVVGVVAARFFGETIRAREAMWALVALAGVGLVLFAGRGTAVNSRTGDLLAIGALLAWSTYFIASKQSRLVLTSAQFTVGSAFWAAALNLPLAFVFGQEFTVPTGSDLLWLVVMTLVAGIVGHSLMNWSLVRIPLWVGSTFTLLIPVAATMIAWLALGETLVPMQVVGTVAVLVALAALVITQKRRPG